MTSAGQVIHQIRRTSVIILMRIGTELCLKSEVKWSPFHCHCLGPFPPGEIVVWPHAVSHFNLGSIVWKIELTWKGSRNTYMEYSTYQKDSFDVGHCPHPNNNYLVALVMYLYQTCVFRIHIMYMSNEYL